MHSIVVKRFENHLRSVVHTTKRADPALETRRPGSKCVGYDEDFQRQLVDEPHPAPYIAISYIRRRQSDSKAHIQLCKTEHPSSTQLLEKHKSRTDSCDDMDLSDPPAPTQVRKGKPTPDFMKRDRKKRLDWYYAH